MTKPKVLKILKETRNKAEGDLAEALDFVIEIIEKQAEYEEYLAEVRERRSKKADGQEAQRDGAQNQRYLF